MEHQPLDGEPCDAAYSPGEAVRTGADSLVTFAVGLPEISEMRARIDEIAEKTGFTENRRADIQVAVSEACATLALSSPEGRVEVTVVVEDDRLEVEIESPVNLQLIAGDGQPPACGTRLALIATLADDLGLHTKPHGGASLLMAFRLETHELSGTPPSEARRAYPLQQERVRLAETLFHISMVLHASLYGPSGVDHSLSIAASALGADIASIERLEDRGLRTTNVAGNKSRLPGRIIPTEAHPLGSAVMETKQIMALGDAQRAETIAMSEDRGEEAILAAPCVILNEVVGVLSLEFQGPRRFEVIEMEFVSQLASVLSLALENIELCKRQQTLLDKLQQSYLRAPEGHPEVQFAHDYRSATEGAHAGGDFHDLFMGPDGRVILAIGDVSGRGLEASRIAHMARDGIRALGLGCADPAMILGQVNRLIFSTGFSGFVTSFVAVLDYQTGEIAGASAGHPAPLLVDHSGATARLQAEYRPPLGSFGDSTYQSVVTNIEEGDILLLFTDGLTEARRDGELFGEDRLMESLKINRSVPIEELPAAILKDVLGFAHGTIRDDAALLALKYTRPQPGANLP